MTDNRRPQAKKLKTPHTADPTECINRVPIESWSWPQFENRPSAPRPVQRAHVGQAARATQAADAARAAGANQTAEAAKIAEPVAENAENAEDAENAENAEIAEIAEAPRAAGAAGAAGANQNAENAENPGAVNVGQKRKRRGVLTCIERWDPKMLHEMLRADSTYLGAVRQDRKTQSRLMKKLVRKLVKGDDGDWQFPTRYDTQACGRLYPIGSGSRALGATRACKIVRRCGMKPGCYTDVDIVNAMPTVLLGECQRHNIPFEMLKVYVARRGAIIESIKKDFGLTRDDVKSRVIAILNGSGYSFCYTQTGQRIPFLHCLYKESQKVMQLVLERLNYDKLCTFYFEAESKIMRTLLEYAEAHPQMRVAALVFDGALIENPDIPAVQAWLRNLVEPAIQQRLGYKVRYTAERLQPTPEDREWLNRPPVELDYKGFRILLSSAATSDVKVGECIAHALNHRAFREGNKTICLFDPQTQIWRRGPLDSAVLFQVVVSELRQMEALANQEFPSDEEHYFGSSCLATVSKIVKATEAFLQRRPGNSQWNDLRGGVLFEDCAYNLESGAPLGPIQPEWHATFTSGHKYYGPETPEFQEAAVLWSQHLDSMFTPDRRQYLESLISVALSGYNTAQCQLITFLTGGSAQEASNGKSTLCQIVRRAFGNYGATASPAILAKQRTSASSANPELAALEFKRFVYIDETEKDTSGEQAPLDSTTIKRLTGETITGRPLYGEVRDMPLHCMIFVASNELNSIKSENDAERRRMRVIPFTKQFYTDPRMVNETQNRFAVTFDDLERINRLQQLSAPLLSVLCHRAHELFVQYGSTWGHVANKSIDASSQARLQTWMSNCDPVQQFFDMLVKNNDAKTTASELFEWFKEWVQAEHGMGERDLPRQNAFAQRLSKYCKRKFGPGVKKKVKGCPSYCVGVKWPGDFRPRGALGAVPMEIDEMFG